MSKYLYQGDNCKVVALLVRPYLEESLLGVLEPIVEARPWELNGKSFQIDCVHNNAIMELMREVRSLLTELISGLGAKDLDPMSLGLSHSLSRYKLKFSTNKVTPAAVNLIKEETALVTLTKPQFKARRSQDRISHEATSV
ncbi:hypothetical protein LguiB_020752 [Lonicera macranthoides]